MIRTLSALSIVLISSAAASAADWKETFDKGLYIYNLKSGSTEVRIVCDPEKLWAGDGFSAQNNIAFIENGAQNASTLTVKKDGQSFVLKMTGGSGSMRDNADYAKTIFALLSGGSIELNGTKAQVSPMRNQKCKF